MLQRLSRRAKECSREKAKQTSPSVITPPRNGGEIGAPTLVSPEEEKGSFLPTARNEEPSKRVAVTMAMRVVEEEKKEDPASSRREIGSPSRYDVRTPTRAAATTAGEKSPKVLLPVKKKSESLPLRTPLSMAIAMRAATTSPVETASFPNSPQTILKEQDWYEQQQLAKLKQSQQPRRRATTREKANDNHGAEKPLSSTAKTSQGAAPGKRLPAQNTANPVVTNKGDDHDNSGGLLAATGAVCQSVVSFCFRIMLLLIVASLLDSNCIDICLQWLAFIGQLAIGLAVVAYMWLFSNPF